MPIGVPFTPNDLENFTKLIYLEARPNPSVRDLSLVGEGIINRVADVNGYFPDSITGVIRQSGQFEPVGNGKLDNAPRPTEAQMATALAIIDTLGNGSDFAALRTGAVFFENPETTQVRGTGLTSGMTQEQIDDVTVYTEQPRHDGDTRHVYYSNALNDWKFDRTSAAIPDWAPIYSRDLQPQLEELRSHPAYQQAVNDLIAEYGRSEALGTESELTHHQQPVSINNFAGLVPDDVRQSFALLMDSTPSSMGQDNLVAQHVPDMRDRSSEVGIS